MPSKTLRKQQLRKKINFHTISRKLHSKITIWNSSLYIFQLKNQHCYRLFVSSNVTKFNGIRRVQKIKVFIVGVSNLIRKWVSLLKNLIPSLLLVMLYKLLKLICEIDVLWIPHLNNMFHETLKLFDKICFWIRLQYFLKSNQCPKTGNKESDSDEKQINKKKFKNY